MIKENQDIESQLQKALDERKVMIGQLKNAEKLLEEIIIEKDDMAEVDSEQKASLKKVLKLADSPVQHRCSINNFYAWLVLSFHIANRWELTLSVLKFLFLKKGGFDNSH